MSAEVIQLRRTKGWRKPEGAVVVARPSKWGNPFRVGEHHRIGGGTVRVDTIEDAAVLFWLWITDRIEFYEDDGTLLGRRLWMRDHLPDLAGRTLACWCPQPGPCHAHVLVALANPEPSP